MTCPKFWGLGNTRLCLLPPHKAVLSAWVVNLSCGAPTRPTWSLNWTYCESDKTWAMGGPANRVYKNWPNGDCSQTANLLPNQPGQQHPIGQQLPWRDLWRTPFNLRPFCIVAAYSATHAGGLNLTCQHESVGRCLLYASVLLCLHMLFMLVHCYFKYFWLML